MDFITEVDKQHIRISAYVIFLEQLIQQQKQQLDGLTAQLNAVTKEKDDAKVQSDVATKTSEGASAAATTVQGSDPAN